MQTTKRKRYQKDAAPTDDIITLINLVRQNPALYNYKLQPNQRRRSDVLNGWAQIASQIGNKYTVEECRRKWKNLRDTYHQYRLRKHKLGDGLSKWRYARELEFLSNVYQPKLKSQRNLDYISHGNGNIVNNNNHNNSNNSNNNSNVTNDNNNLLDSANTSVLTEDDDVQEIIEEQHVNSIVAAAHQQHHQHNQHHAQQQQHHHQQQQQHHHHHHHHQQQHHGHHHHHHHSNIMVNDEAETFILATYEESVTDDATMAHMELTHAGHDDEDDVDGVEDVEQIVKHEPASLDDDDGTGGTEVDYEEVCLYEDTSAGNVPRVDCETIVTSGGGTTINGANNVANGNTVTAEQNFHYITSSNDFCIEPETNSTGIMVNTNTVNGNNSNSNNNSTNNNNNNVSGIKLKGVTVLSSSSSLAAALNSPNVHHQQQQQQQHNQATSTATSPGSQVSFTTNNPLLQLHQHDARMPTTLLAPNNANHNNGHMGNTTSGNNTTGLMNMARDELDLFFDFLKKKMQYFSKEEITGIQVEFLNCVLKREAEQRHNSNLNNHHHNNVL